MILYHFTAIERIKAILREGLSKGEVPLSQTATAQAVWFTTECDSRGHGLSDARPLSEAEIAFVMAANSISREKASGLRFVDKRRVRIQTTISSRDRKLSEWLPFARKHLDRSWMDVLHRTGGGAAKARTWWIYKGIVAPSQFTEVAVRRADDSYSPITDDDLGGAQEEVPA